jgi:hypothetical protein
MSSQICQKYGKIFANSNIVLAAILNLAAILYLFLSNKILIFFEFVIQEYAKFLLLKNSDDCESF